MTETPGTPPAKQLLGLEFADLDTAGAAEWLAARPAEAPFGYVVTPNADHLVRLSRDPALAMLYKGALLCLLDSRVVARLAHVLGLMPPRVAPGSDVTAQLLRRHLLDGERITIVGMRENHLARLVSRLGLAAPAHYDPPMGFDQDPKAFAAAVDFVLTHPARLVFLAVGSPRQERLAAAIAATGQATGTGLCIGASLAFLADTERRAPVVIQRLGLEWLFRLLGNPQRLWRRYLVDSPVIIWLLFVQRFRCWLSRPGKPQS